MKPMQTANLNIFEYLDYRMFLQDYYSLKKSTSRHFTYRYFAQKAGVSASLLKDILSGRQNLTLKVARKYGAAMQLKEREAAYFEALIAFNNAKTNASKNECFARMVKLRGREASKFLDVKQYDYFSTWYHPVVREVAGHLQITDPEKIAAIISPDISSSQVRKSLQLLTDLGLLVKDSSGKWACTSPAISSEYEIQSLALKNYHKEMLQLAVDALERYSSENREFQTVTLSMSPERFAEIKERIRSFTDDLLRIAVDDPAKPTRVFQVSLQMFPFAQLDEKS